jgi:DNA-binding MarR family transcriptional regulator
MGIAADASGADGMDLGEATRQLSLLLPRLVARAKRIAVPAELRGLALGPRHLSLLSVLLLDGPSTVNELAAVLYLAPTTVSLMISQLADAGVVLRQEDPADRRRRLVSLAPERYQVIDDWLGRGAAAWRQALEPLSPQERQTVVSTLLAFERLHPGPPD